MSKAFCAVLALAVSAAFAPASAAPASGEGASASGSGQTLDLDKIICRRDSVVGSRVQKRRTCKTRRQWNKDNDQLREVWSEFQRKATGAVPNN